MNQPTPNSLKCSTNSGKPYPDGSGAPCVVEVMLGRQLLRYAADFIDGETRIHLLSNPVGMTTELYQECAQVARRQYNEWLDGQVGQDWKDLNCKVYGV